MQRGTKEVKNPTFPVEHLHLLYVVKNRIEK